MRLEELENSAVNMGVADGVDMWMIPLSVLKARLGLREVGGLVTKLAEEKLERSFFIGDNRVEDCYLTLDYKGGQIESYLTEYGREVLDGYKEEYIQLLEKFMMI